MDIDIKRHIRQTTDLKKMFCSYSEIFDEMRPMRSIEHKGKARRITSFVGKQKDVCKLFGFSIPKGYDARYKSKKTGEKIKLGRPKQVAVVDES